MERVWSLTGREGKTTKGPRLGMTTGTNRASESERGAETENEGWTVGSVRHKNWWRSGQVKLAQSRATMECWISGWTAPNQEVVEAVREAWIWNSGKDECVCTSAGPEAAYWRGRSLAEWAVTISQDKLQQVMDLRATGPWERALSYWRIPRQQDLSECTGGQFSPKPKHGLEMTDEV
jgi:hypothetical protein